MATTTAPMATVRIRVDAFDALPGICAKTGEPTEIRMKVAAEYVPLLLRWLQLWTVWSFLFAKTGRHRRRQVRLPVSATAFRRYRVWQVGSATVLFAGLVAGIVASVLGHPLVELVGYVVAVIGFTVGARAYQRNWVGLSLDRRGRFVTVSRCHPRFAEAVRQTFPPARARRPTA